MPIYLDIFNRTGYKVVHQNLESVIGCVLKEKGVAGPVELSISVVNKDEMADLHLKYLKTREATNVLSFPTEEGVSADGIRHLGDIVVCEDFVRGQKDMEFLVEHGLRHLLGEHHNDS